MKITVLILASLVSVFAEPPAYLPPTNNFRISNALANVPTALGTQRYSYASIKPNTQYGPPTTNQEYDAVRGGYSNADYHNHGGYFGAGGYHREDYNSVPANYNFQYHVYAPEYGNDFGHQEARQGDVAQGRYFVLLPDGRKQTVEYIADQNGYNPTISYTGTAVPGYNNGYNNGGYPGVGAYSRSENFYASNQNGNYHSSQGQHVNNGGYRY